MDDFAPFEVVPVAAPLDVKSLSWFDVWLAEAAWDEATAND